MFKQLRRQLSSRIRYKIILPYVFLAAALIGLLGIAVSWLAANSLQKQLDQKLQTSGTNTGLGLETLEARLLDNLRPIVTAGPNITEQISSTADAFAARDIDQIQKIVAIASNYYDTSRILAFDVTGTVVVDTAKTEVRERSPSVVGSSDLARDRLVQAVIAGEKDQYGDKYASLLQFSTDPPYTMFFVIAPVKVETPTGGERVVGAMMFAEPLESIVQNELPPRNNATITTILNGQGTVLASYPPENIGTDLMLTPNQIAQLKALQQDPDPEKKSLFTNIRRGDIAFQVMYSPLRIRRNLDGYFAVALPRSDIDNVWNQTRIAVGIFSIGALALMIWTGLRVTQSITTPLDQLVATALQVKGGDLERRSFVSSQNELGTLASVLNDMTDRLLDLYRTSRQVGSELSIGGVLQQTTAAINRLIPDAQLAALVVNNDTWNYYTTDTEREVRDPFSPATLDSLVPVVDLAQDEAITQALSEFQPAPRIVLPLRTQQKSIGILTIATSSADFTVAALHEPLSAIASMAATAIQNATLYSTVQDEAGRKQAILQSIADGVVVFDSDGQIILSNSAAAAMLNVPPTALIGRTFDDLKLVPIQGAAELFASGSTTTFYQSGEHILSLSAAPVESQDGRNSGEVLVLHDVTAEREMDRAKTDFIATISHELRTPLTSICGYADLLLRGFAGDLSEEQLDFMKTIRQQGQTMVDVLQNVIIIASIEAGTMTVYPQPYPVLPLVEQAIGATRKAIESKNLALIVDVPLELPSINVDRDHFKIVLVQLLDNARRYTQNGSITIRANKHEDMVKIDVIDTGQGIALSDQQRLFNRFQRGGEQSGLTSKERGVGLGLAIARQLIEGFGGRISVISDIGAGSTFSILLPAVSEAQLQTNEYGVATTVTSA